MQEIKDAEGRLLAVWGSKGDVPEGRFFYGDGKEALQWGTQKLGVGETIQPHIHKVRERYSKGKTIEAFIVLAGVMQVDIYGLDKALVETVLLGTGAFLVAYDGGHGFKALCSGTKLLEVKQGPFTSWQEDKEKF
jgi:hypothetical protein